MTADKGNSRRFFMKRMALAGLAYSGIGGFADNRSRAETVKQWDVIVVGGGPGGVPAAVAAARNGARVLLVERYGFLGGMATTALVHPYMKYKAGNTVLSRGLFEEFVSVMRENGVVLEDRAHFDAEPMKRLLDRFVLASGVDLLLHSQAVGVLRDGARVKAVRIFNKAGIEDIAADIVIDSTGDGDIAAWAGAPVEIGRTQDSACQPMTTSFRMANVDMAAMPPREEINRLYDAAKVRGEVTNPRENVLIFRSVHPDVLHFNTTRVVGKSNLDSWTHTDAEIEGRRQVDDMVRFLKKYVKGFENAYLMKIGPEIGVRESRRIMGEYVLTDTDVLGAKKFEDGIACACYDIDIHNPSGTGTVIQRLKEGEWYTIPFRCLVPRNVDNLIVASRCISSTHEAHSSLRVMPIVWCIGQAGGTAAAMCVKKSIRPADIDVRQLRKTLTDQKAFV